MGSRHGPDNKAHSACAKSRKGLTVPFLGVFPAAGYNLRQIDMLPNSPLLDKQSIYSREKCSAYQEAGNWGAYQFDGDYIRQQGKHPEKEQSGTYGSSLRLNVLYCRFRDATPRFTNGSALESRAKLILIRLLKKSSGQAG